MVPEAPLEQTGHGLAAQGEGWFVLNARDAVWGESKSFGVFTRLGESKEARFPQVGFNIGVLWPGQPACMYHREPNQEDFLIAEVDPSAAVDRAWGVGRSAFSARNASSACASIR